MRLIFLAAFLLNVFFSAGHAEERIALVVGNPAFAGFSVSIPSLGFSTT